MEEVKAGNLEKRVNELKTEFSNNRTGFNNLKGNLKEKANGGLKSEVNNLRTDLSKLSKN